nr:hypothetical protein L203_02810 [Cryptococcus depauperatus CBS 7841]
MVKLSQTEKPTLRSLPLDRLLLSTDQANFSARLQLADVSTAIAKARKVVVVSGAGISCSSGIPDFRSDGGLYDLVKSKHPDAFFTGKELFSAGTFANPQTASIFYTFIAELFLSCAAAQPTRTHHFIQKLEQKGKLLRSYTQNVDGLERRLGLESGGRGKGLKKKGTRNVELHGDLSRVRCVLCFSDFEATQDWVEMFREGEAPDCPACWERCESRINRAARATTIGTLRPSIVLYDEPHPHGDDIGLLTAYDCSRQPDLLLIMGTSLKVHGLKRLVKDLAKAVHSGNKKGLVVFVNATPPSKEWEGIIDVHIEGQTDTWVEKVEEEWRRVKPGDWQVQTTLDGEVIPVVKMAKPKGKCKATANKNASFLCSPPRSPDRFISSSQVSCSQVSDAFDSDMPISSQQSQLTDINDLCLLSSAPPTPVSPEKRAIHSDASPNKKRRVYDIPSTGMPATPGRGNLFVSPQKYAREPEDDSVFGSPTKPVTKGIPKSRATFKMARKENASAGAAKTQKTRAGVAASATGKVALGSRVTRKRTITKA